MSITKKLISTLQKEDAVVCFLRPTLSTIDFRAEVTAVFPRDAYKMMGDYSMTDYRRFVASAILEHRMRPSRRLPS